MNTVDRFTHWCLARAAQRWPTGLREEMHAEWLAELATLEADQGTAKERLGYAFSLLAAPPIRDANGAPRGWGESLAPGAPAVGLLVAALITLSVSAYSDSLAVRLLRLVGVEPVSPGAEWLTSLVGAVLTLAWCLLAGRWLGRRRPFSRTGRFGDAGPAVLAPVAFAPMVVLGALPDGELPYLLGVLAGLLIWAPGTAAVGVAAVRAAGRGRAAALMLIGVPLVSAGRSRVPRSTRRLLVRRLQPVDRNEVCTAVESTGVVGGEGVMLTTESAVDVLVLRRDRHVRRPRRPLAGCTARHAAHAGRRTADRRSRPGRR